MFGTPESAWSRHVSPGLRRLSLYSLIGLLDEDSRLKCAHFLGLFLTFLLFFSFSKLMLLVPLFYHRFQVGRTLQRVRENEMGGKSENKRSKERGEFQKEGLTGSVSDFI